MIGIGCVRGDHGGVKVDIGGGEVIEEEASVAEIGEGESAEANELECEELGLAMAESDEKRLELLEMVEVIGFG